MGVATSPIFEFSQNMFTKPSATSMALAAGEVYQRTFQANSAYLALTTPDDVYDYTANITILNGDSLMLQLHASGILTAA